MALNLTIMRSSSGAPKLFRFDCVVCLPRITQQLFDEGFSEIVLKRLAFHADGGERHTASVLARKGSVADKVRKNCLAYVLHHDHCEAETIWVNFD